MLYYWAFSRRHYSDVIMGTMTSQITSITIVYLTVYSGADQRKHQNSASLAFVRGIHWLPVNSPDKGPVTRKMFPFDDVIMNPTKSQGAVSVYSHRLTSIGIPIIKIRRSLWWFPCCWPWHPSDVTEMQYRLDSYNLIIYMPRKYSLV